MENSKPIRLIAGAVLMHLVSYTTPSDKALDRLVDISGLEKSAACPTGEK
jgi:hypothetical protein